MLRFDIAGSESLDELENVIEENIDELRKQSGQRALVVRLLIEGSGLLASELRRPGAAEDLLDHLRTTLASSSPLLWIESLREQTASPLDLDSRRGHKDLAGHVLGVADRLRELDNLPEGLERHLAPLFSHHYGRQVLEPVLGSRFKELLTGAERLCIELLDDSE